MTLLGAAEIRELAESLDLRPAKSLGQNFVIDGNVCQKIVRVAGVTADDIALEIGPGLGSLTLALLEVTPNVIAIEIDQRLADRLPITVSEHKSGSYNLTVVNTDALAVRELPAAPTVLVANLPYNVSVPVLLHLLEILPSLNTGVVMVQAEVADRLSAKPGSKEYGIPSLKASWWAEVIGAGSVSRSIFWPVPGVDSKLIGFKRRPTPGGDAMRRGVFRLVDAAFAQRRKMLRAALSGIFGNSAKAEAVLISAGVDPTLRGESLLIDSFCAIYNASQSVK